MTNRESILGYVAQLLTQVPNASVSRSREEAIARAEGTWIVVKPTEEPVENRAGGGPRGLALRNLTFTVSVIARAQPGGDAADTVADPIMQAVHAALMVDTTLGGLCATVIEHSTTWDFELADGTALAADMRYIARYQTPANSLSVVQ